MCPSIIARRNDKTTDLEVENLNVPRHGVLSLMHQQGTKFVFQSGAASAAENRCKLPVLNSKKKIMHLVYILCTLIKLKCSLKTQSIHHKPKIQMQNVAY